ncbi:Amino acid transporter AVT1I [Sesamum angolense]|uniref:Amino acid transporter AVT1I n=1 Tax=Sesamum angolense TaxID=2727404 RepID=A0AAE1X1M5_9LAMI|nr:Amino acid transporter AVT1I [Sesamum angolense]
MYQLCSMTPSDLRKGLLLKGAWTQTLSSSKPIRGAQAFGRKGRAVISIFMYLELFLLAVEFLILEGDNLHKLFPNFCVHVFGKRVGGKQAFILLTALVMLPTTWLRNLSLLAYVSAGGILASVVLVATVSWIGAVEGVGFSEKGVLLRCDGLATAISLYTFCYCGHAIFPTLCTSMKDKNQFPKNDQLNDQTSLVISTVMVALVVPFFGYVMAFIGAFLSISASILFPCLCYLKINKASRRFGVELMFILAILVLGFIVAVMGTFISVERLYGMSEMNECLLITGNKMLANSLVIRLLIERLLQCGARGIEL